MRAKQAKSANPDLTTLTVFMEKGLRGRVKGTASLLGQEVSDYVADVLKRDVDRLGLINEEAVAKATA